MENVALKSVFTLPIILEYWLLVYGMGIGHIGSTVNQYSTTPPRRRRRVLNPCLHSLTLYNKPTK